MFIPLFLLIGVSTRVEYPSCQPSAPSLHPSSTCRSGIQGRITVSLLSVNGQRVSLLLLFYNSSILLEVLTGVRVCVKPLKLLDEI